ncbi:excitatory amino acid transporter 1-like [Heptranchias perlo]|uniref:excitatory amino acid transporter 1-like n=1 Tax=Heptranchias perlo TaxID=212740 RepID=UPI00355A7246
MTKSSTDETISVKRMERIEQGFRRRTMSAKKRVQNISREDVKKFLNNNGFVLFTVVAVIVGWCQLPEDNLVSLTFNK